MEIAIGGFYLACVEQTFPHKKGVTRHVEIIRAVDSERWEAVNTHTPTETFIVTGNQLTPESDEMRASREASWQRHGRPT